MGNSVSEKLVALILRHGATDLNLGDTRYRSWLDVPLAKAGLDQAQDAAEFLKSFPIKRILCSPLLRAFVTADIAAKPHKLEVYQHRGLLPWRLGVFSGRSKKDNQPALKLFVQTRNIAIPDGESLDAFEDRQFAFFKAVLGEGNQPLTLMVCHTSNVAALQNFTDDQYKGEPEDSDMVKPGGVLAVYWDGKMHRAEPVFGKSEPAQFGGS
jgi:broad specificity phosphatase PhoE